MRKNEKLPNTWHTRKVSNTERELLTILATSAGIQVLVSAEHDPGYRVPSFGGSVIIFFCGNTYIQGDKISYNEAIKFLKQKVKERQI